MQTLKTLGQIAGIGGVALGIALLLLRDLLKKLPRGHPTKHQWLKLVLVFMALVWSLGVLGIVAWLYSETMGHHREALPPESGNHQPAALQTSTRIDISVGDDKSVSLSIRGEMAFEEVIKEVSQRLHVNVDYRNLPSIASARVSSGTISGKDVNAVVSNIQLKLKGQVVRYVVSQTTKEDYVLYPSD